MKYAITYVLGAARHVLIVEAPDRDDAYAEARSVLMKKKLYSASLQGTCRVASQDDIEEAERDRF